MSPPGADAAKSAAAQAVLELLPEDAIIGVGTGSTVNRFIELLATRRTSIAGAVASSEATASLLKAARIPVHDLNTVGTLELYVDGADEVNAHLQLIKGGGGALTREKILAAVARKFVCIVDASKSVDLLGEFPLPVEVIPMARSYVARELVRLGGLPEYRQGYVTDNGNVIIDVHSLDLRLPVQMEQRIDQIVGVVCNGLFAVRTADLLLVGNADGSVSRATAAPATTPTR